MSVLGILGVGHLAEYLVLGWRRAGIAHEILLSPRGAAMAAKLAAEQDCAVAPDNETLVASSDVLVLATRPAHAVPAATGLPWRAGQTVVSVVAGLETAALAPAVAPARLVRTMPITCCAIGESPTVMYPEDRVTRQLFEGLGRVLAVPDEARFTTASVFGAYYGWVFALIEQSARWAAEAGLEPALARDLVAQTVKGAAAMALARPEESLAEIIAGLATDGSITKHGLDRLIDAEAFGPWQAACQGVHDRLLSDHAKAD